MTNTPVPDQTDAARFMEALFDLAERNDKLAERLVAGSVGYVSIASWLYPMDTDLLITRVDLVKHRTVDVQNGGSYYDNRSFDDKYDTSVAKREQYKAMKRDCALFIKEALRSGYFGQAVKQANDNANVTYTLALKVPRWDDSRGKFMLQPSTKYKLVISIERDVVCEARVVGQETVEVRDYDNVPKKTVTRDIIEWDCKPLMVGA